MSPTESVTRLPKPQRNEVMRDRESKKGERVALDALDALEKGWVQANADGRKALLLACAKAKGVAGNKVFVTVNWVSKDETQAKEAEAAFWGMRGKSW
jgi:hypothetical protein